ncbi:bluetail domain-containing putative surface protein [Leptolyngbya subtilissima]|uniref:Cadherin-like domain-containing protein n=1 Tax=Leptolyngbya subtilissima DQ-A4 TaxID=2933933 RepID=A0ABV0K9Y1_9CYAN|nr:bluetail domain-containing putative surface protein [Nodosilinea sp. FACHB-141]
MWCLVGSVWALGASLNLSDLNGSNGFVINGIDVNDFSGFSISSAGDINGDGIDDLIVGASGADPNGIEDAGESYVVFGGTGVGAGGSLNLSDLNGSNSFVINGIDVNDESGFSVSSAGDINNDGIDDLLIGASGAAPNGNYLAGESYVVFGRANDFAPDALDDSGFTANQSTPLVTSATALLANDTDPDANTVLRITAVGGATGGRVALSNNDTPNDFADDFVTFTPDASFDGTASFVYTLSDGSLSDTATVSIVVGKTVTGGNSKDTLIGTAGNDNLNSGNGDDRLVGNAAGDALTGGNGTDRFVVSSLSDSLLSNIDRITDLKIGTDVIDGPAAVSAANVAELSAVASLTEADISAVLTAGAFGINRAATFSLGSRTFIALNNDTAGFQEASDAVIEITGFNGNLTSLAIA